MERSDPEFPGRRGYEPRYSASVPIYLVLTLVTCGIFNLYWNYRQMQACNELLASERFNFVVWLLLVIVTCGIYHLIYQYMMGAAINEIQQRRGLPVTENLPFISLIAAILGVGIVADCIHQIALNQIEQAL